MITRAPASTGLGVSLRWLRCGFLVLLLTACASQTQVKTTPTQQDLPHPGAPSGAQQDTDAPEEAAWEQREAQLASHREWRARGKVAYRSPARSGSATLDWRQAGSSGELKLSGPLGVGTTRIASSGDSLLIEQDGIERLYPPDAAPWLGQDSYLPIPIESIAWWIKGTSDPNFPVDALERDGPLTSRLEQRGWLIEVSRYRDFSGLQLPARMTLHHADSSLQLRLILRRWELAGK